MNHWEACWSEGNTPWDRGAAAPPLIELLDSEWAGFLKDARVLVPGCGSGHDVRALAEFGAFPVGLDLVPRALEVAREIPSPGRVQYEAGDFLDASRVGFDGLWEHTCFCAISPDRREDYVRAAARAVRPGGYLYAVFFLNPDHEEEGPPFRSTREEIHQSFSPHFEFLASWIPERAYAGREGREWLVVAQRRAEEVASEPSGG
ncbi:SAM-dependent methyltransferase [Haloferula luteola]|uniref:SAM-dependent methyltransferase n=1 Tax=Haloferula luteola TaxID=595692 RepID=A0A840UUG4_9BACT|nr:methyltransferase domain-containing protein [Haloferula luteola]MBB5349837.1 SAM-dependent methyltransferase [Haloferula luteola]